MNILVHDNVFLIQAWGMENSTCFFFLPSSIDALIPIVITSINF